MFLTRVTPLSEMSSCIRTSLQVMGVRMSKFSAMIRSELHLLSRILQVGGVISCLTMGGKSATTEQSAPVKPATDIGLQSSCSDWRNRHRE